MKGLIFATCRISSEYALPMPAITDWFRSTPFSWTRPSRFRMSPKSSSDRLNGSGPSRAIPGTSAGSRTTYTASFFCVPASVKSNPDPSSSTTRSAIGPLPGRTSPVDCSSRHRNHPARARWITRWIPCAEMSRNFPCRCTSSISNPTSDEIGGSYVFSALIAVMSARTKARSTARSRRNPANDSTSGSSGTHPLCPQPEDMSRKSTPLPANAGDSGSGTGK